MIKSHRIAIGLLAAAGMSQSAFALDQATVDGIVGTANEFFLSGASASDSSTKAEFQNNLCLAGTYDLYQDAGFGTFSAGSSWYAMTCTLKTTGQLAAIPASLSGQNVIVHKRSKIGSLYGSYPIALGSYVEFMNIISTRASGTCTNSGAATGSGLVHSCTVSAALASRDVPRHVTNTDECDYQTLAGANPLVGGDVTKDTLCRRASVGISDVESEMFQGINLTNLPGDNFAALTSGQLNGTTAVDRRRTFGQVFGVAVSQNAWEALQAAQGITVGNPAADGSNWPTLTRDSIRQLLSGGASQWTQVIGAYNPAAGNNIAVCRREQGSGSQAASNAFFFEVPLTSNNGSPATDTGGAPNGSGLFVKENTSSGDARTCLTNANSGTLPGGVYGGIGVLGFDRAAPATGWRWVKIDGVLPSLQNAITGSYDFWYETQVMWNKKVAGSGGASTIEKDLGTLFRGQIADPTRLTAANAPGIGALSASNTSGNFNWDDGVNNTAFNANLINATNPVFGGRHGPAGFPASGAPISTRAIVNTVDNPAVAPNRTK